MAKAGFRNLAARSIGAGLLLSAAVLLSSCTTAAWERFFYDNAKNVCDSSAYHCDGGYRTGDEWRHPGGTAPKPNLPKNTPPY